jgi:putative ABC transport system permease protein
MVKMTYICQTTKIYLWCKGEMVMFLFKRAWFYVKRKWGKALTVGIILFVVSTLSLTGLLIKSASNSTFEVARDKLGADVTYTSDLSSLTQSIRGNGGMRGTGGFKVTLPDDYKAITTKEIERIASNSKYVDSYTINASLAGEPVDFSYYNPAGNTDEDPEESNSNG